MQARARGGPSAHFVASPAAPQVQVLEDGLDGYRILDLSSVTRIGSLPSGRCKGWATKAIPVQKSWSFYAVKADLPGRFDAVSGKERPSHSSRRL